MDLNQLPLEVGGVTRTFQDWTWDFVDSYYPDIGQRPYRVPALHFNQQTLIAPKGAPTAGSTADPVMLLSEPVASTAVGDLAHTLVLERLEDLSHLLTSSGRGPLFIISTVSYDNYLAKLATQTSTPTLRGKHPPPQPATPTAEESQHSHSPSANSQSPHATASIQRKGKQPLPPTPVDWGGQDGEIDILLLHRTAGVVMMEVKAVGHASNTWTPSEEELQHAVKRRVKRAQQQLLTGRDTLHYVMPDLQFPNVTLVVALPYVTRKLLMKAVSTLSLDRNLRFLCKDDLWPHVSESTNHSPTTPTQGTSNDKENSSSAQGEEMSGLLSWWGNIVCADDAAEFPVDSMKTVAGRICGLMSVVSVWTTGRPRIEVRTQGQALGESGRRLAQIVLLPRQADLLGQPALQRMWLTGPMGSGKTLMLQLKGRQWLKEGRRVVVINVRNASRGRPQGHVLERSIRRGDSSTGSGMGTVERHDIALDEFSFEVLKKELEAAGPMEGACFVVDEVLSDMSYMGLTLADHYPRCPIWCAASYLAPVPKAFSTFTLGAVIRNPPSVQLMLKEIDLNPQHQSAYTTRSAARGLPCDGPPIIFIDHTKHDTHVRHLDCQQCADDLADVFEHQLGLKLQPPGQGGSEQQSKTHVYPLSASTSPPQNPKQVPSTVEASPLSFRDVLILAALPPSSFRHDYDYHWETSIPDVLQFILYTGSSRFMSVLRQRGVPLKFAVDNTQKEIAFPPEDEVIISDVMGMHSLERKVVILLRCGPALTLEEVLEHVSRYQTVQAASGGAGVPEMSAIRELLKTPQDPETISKQLHFFASLLYELRDMMYPQMSIPPSLSSEEAKAIFHQLLGNMLVAGTQSFPTHKVSIRDPQRAHLRPWRPLSDSVPRRGMEYRCYVPQDPDPEPEPDPDLESDPDPDHVQSRVPEASPIQRRVKSSQLGREADCTFFVPNLPEDVEQRQGEVRRIRKALEGLSEDDLDWEFFAASRCLSQYISILY
ncbi:hypothetical protein ACOMHN_058440 [Nucella lapillus]